MRFVLVFFLFLMLGSNAFAQKDGFVSKHYHNTLARYNGYFLAKENMKAAEKKLSETSIDNFSRILKVYPKLTAQSSASINAELEDAIKKGSLPIHRHKTSRWVDNCYIVIGKSRFFKLDYENAIITFKFVNKTSDNPDDKHESLTWLMRSFTQTEQYENALSVVSYLKKENLNDKNKELFTLAKAELFQAIDNKESFIQSIEEAAQYVKSRNNKARTNFILGQLYQEKGVDEKSYLAYKNAIKKSPTYEMSFYAKLYMNQVRISGSDDDNKKIIKYYKKLLRDEKNIEYKDKIYYEMAKFERKQNHYPEALSYLNKSLRANTTNENQKAYSYLMMAETYFDNLKNYRKAAMYYDSTLTVLAKDENNYEAIAKRGAILKEYITQITIIETEDSLLRLSVMDTSKLYAFLDSTIKVEEEKKLKEQERQKKLAQQQNNTQSNMNTLNTSMGGQAAWYFYNAASLSRGKTNFKNIWGDRELEDNWRRKNKDKVFSDGNDEDDNDEEASNNKAHGDNKVDDKKSQQEIDKSKILAQRKQLLKTIPFSEQQKVASNAKIEEAMYKLGNIYHLKLEELMSAAETYQNLLKRYPQHENKIEVYYILYIIFKKLNNAERMEYYKNILLNQYENSVYAKLVLDPDYLIKNAQLNKKAQMLYNDAFNLYEQEHYDSSYKMCDSIMLAYPDNDIMDKLIFLKIINKGNTDSSLADFKTNLEKFIKDFESSNLVPLANDYLKRINAHMTEAIKPKDVLTNPEKPIEFKTDFNEVHYFIVVFKNEKINQNDVKINFAKYNDANHKSSNLIIQTMQFDDKNFILMIKNFDNKNMSMNYFNAVSINKDLFKDLSSEDFTTFVISKSNYPIFYQRKALEEYIAFFNEKYNPSK